ncbi:hypothetical protein GCM10009721_39720 [Terrabacter tumescens]|uniref:Uncharacterized protein n=1 Tax=Terrabacter tumescens TaxID=60443 RepID=A0ABQ2IH08_9MICO|nr:hypothetical protein [Terrabacter tumescens]GGN08052.1 hypothetical protein GCM10009721_39720 [Terrabacter tumescens]
MEAPTPRLPSEQPSKPFATFEPVANRVPGRYVHEPIGDYSDLPKELANLAHDAAGLDRVDRLITPAEVPPTTAAAVVHALAMYLCD